MTAKWLNHLLDERKSQREVKNILFAKQYDINVIIPSMKPIAAWMALWDEGIKNHIMRIAPEVLIENGDPSALPVEFRKLLLTRFAEFYAERRYTGTSFDITMIRRLADPELAPTINTLLQKYATNNDVSALLLKLIWQGQISGSVVAALPYALDKKASSYIRICAINAVAKAGTTKQHRELIKALLPNIPTLSSRVIATVCDLFFPGIITVPKLLKILKTTKPPEQFSSYQLRESIEDIAEATLLEKSAEKLLRGLHKLLKKQPFIKQRPCEISKRYAWLLPNAIMLANRFIRTKHKFHLDPIVLDLVLGFLAIRNYDDIYTHDKNEILKDAKASPEFRYNLFWHAVAATRNRKKDNKTYSTEYWQLRPDISNFWTPNAEDLEKLFKDLIHRPLINDRLIALSAIIAIYMDGKRPPKLREKMKRVVSGTPELEAKLHDFFHPKPQSKEEKKLRRQQRNSERKYIKRKQFQEANRKNWQTTLKKKPHDVRNVGNPQEGLILPRTTYLYNRIKEKNNETGNGLGCANWKELVDEFGSDVAKNFRDGCIAYWRDYDPFTDSNHRTTSSTPWSQIIGLTGLAMEANDDPNWVTKINSDDARIAAHYSVCELNGFPSWLAALFDKFPDLVDAVIKNELCYELHEAPLETNHAHTLLALSNGDKDFSTHYKNTLYDLMLRQEPANDFVFNQTLSLILDGQLNAAFMNKVVALACKRFAALVDTNRKLTWLIALFHIDGVKGCKLLKAWIATLSSQEERKETMINFCARLTSHRGPRFALAVSDYERVEVLGELLPFIFKFVKVEEDLRHKEGGYTPVTRDDASNTRSHLLNIIFNTPGRSSYNVLMKLSKTTNHAYFKDRIEYLAKERAALDAEHEEWTGEGIAEFALLAEKKPSSELDLYKIALSRLDDIKMDFEDGDQSEAGLFKKAKKETLIRNSFANRLKILSRSHYTVASEEEFADGKRTDIRLNATSVPVPVPIELKIANNCSLAVLRERMDNQLIGQYMKTSRYGIFLIVNNGKNKKNWQGNTSRKLLSFVALIEALKQHADTLIKKYPKIEAIEVVGIDFTVRGC